MKNQIKTFAALVAVLCGLSLSAEAVNYPWSTTGPILPSNQQNILTSAPTNGQYSLLIYTNTVETNLWLLSSGNSGNVITFALTGQGTTATVTNMAVVLTTTASPVSVTNSTGGATIGALGSAAPRATFATVNLALNGTTAVTSNITYTISSTPAFNGKLSVYVESVGNNSTAGSLTNWSIVPVNN